MSKKLKPPPDPTEPTHTFMSHLIDETKHKLSYFRSRLPDHLGKKIIGVVALIFIVSMVMGHHTSKADPEDIAELSATIAITNEVTTNQVNKEIELLKQLIEDQLPPPTPPPTKKFKVFKRLRRKKN